MNKKILIAVPCMDQVPAQFAHSLATLTSYGIEGYDISIWFNLGSLIYTSRNAIAKKAIMDEADLVMWFDSDMVLIRTRFGKWFSSSKKDATW